MTPEDFQEWKDNPVTKLFLESVVKRIEGTQKEIALNAGESPTSDFYRRGYVQALFDILESQYDD